MGQCLKELIGGSKDLPYLENTRYNIAGSPDMDTPSRTPPNMSHEELDKLAKQKIENKKDLLYRKCSGFPFVKNVQFPTF